MTIHHWDNSIYYFERDPSAPPAGGDTDAPQRPPAGTVVLTRNATDGLALTPPSFITDTNGHWKYQTDVTLDALSMQVSADNGLTWSAPLPSQESIALGIASAQVATDAQTAAASAVTTANAAIPKTQRSVAGGVAGLDVDGDVIDAAGVKITGGATLTDNGDGTATLTEGTDSAVVYEKAQADQLLAAKADAAATTTALAGKQSVDTLTKLAPRATGSDQLAALQDALNGAASLGLTLTLNGDHVINGQLTLATGAKVDGTFGSITQTKDLTPAFNLSGVSGIRLRNVTLKGKTTDWVNTSSVHGATAVYLTNVSDLRIEHCTFTGWAGDGVFVNTGCSNIHIHRTILTGPGPAVITTTADNFGGGVNVQPGVTNWSVVGCDISGFAQGINTGDNQTDVRIAGNYIHDIPGQHGMYIETCDGGIITDNIVRNTGLLGMKIQIGTTTASDPDSNIIANNVFINVGDAGILLTRPQAGTGIVRRTIIASNIITGAGADGITINNADSVVATGNLITNAGRCGISITNSSDITITGGRVDGCVWEGLRLDGVSDWTVEGLRIKNPASGDVSTDEFGVKTVNACSDGTLRGCKITDANGHMRYGIYVNGGDLTTMGFLDNIVTGATDYGYRGVATNARTFRGNQFAGALGSILTGPLNPASLSVVVANGATAPAGLPDGTVIVEKSA